MDRAELMRQVRAGEYVVDPHAVAGAMLSHASTREMLMRPLPQDDGPAAPKPAGGLSPTSFRGRSTQNRPGD
jgi:hypothetical protein